MNQIKMQFDITFMNKKQKVKKIIKEETSKKYKIEPAKIDINVEPNLRIVK
jgi:hypothetical protein